MYPPWHSSECCACSLPGASIRISGFLLSLVSPVFYAMICWDFKEGTEGKLELDDVDEGAFLKVIALACGEEGVLISGIAAGMELAKIADRLQISVVSEKLNEVLCRHLTVEECAEVLSTSSKFGLADIEQRTRSFVLERFDEVAATQGFIQMEEDVLGSLLDDTALLSAGEEAVFEALMRWMKKGEKGLLGEQLLKTIRFPLMSQAYLESAQEALPESGLLKSLLWKAASAEHAASGGHGITPQEPNALVPRKGMGIPWHLYASSGERLIAEHQGGVCSLVECMGRVCSSSINGGILVWNKSTLEVERVLQEDGDDDDGTVLLANWQGKLVTSYDGNKMRVWNITTGTAELQLKRGHRGDITALVVCGQHLVSGTSEGEIKVWTRDASLGHQQERCLKGHPGYVFCLAVWNGKVISGSHSESEAHIRVWDVATENLDVALKANSTVVIALTVGQGRVISAGGDGALQIWQAGSWELLHTVNTHSAVSDKGISFLALHGSTLLVGNVPNDPWERQEADFDMNVWDLKSIVCTHTIRRPRAGTTTCVLSVGAEVWCSAWNRIVVWGANPAP